ncbi:unnamed protein product [Sphagnum troendelagicum]|uniref:Chromatin assembly factor 1 subunit A dimerization domain-containing protein n=1 Tax=Sphagnum troendelagicum TaxID=128251 RepID=A0ABP0UIX0_9BRYO
MNKINHRPCSDREKERFRQLEVAKELKRQLKDQRKEQKRNEREAAMELERIRKKKEKDLKKQQDKADKEQKRKEKEAVESQKDKKRKEREAIEAEREQKRKEKDLKKQQEEAEKEQKKKEKEAAERKKQLVIQKQATIMDKLFRRKEPETPAQQTEGAEEMHKGQQSLSPLEQSITGSNSCSNPAATHMTTAQMDQELTVIQSRSVEELLRSHITAWQGLKKVTALEKPQRWGLRRKPKVSIYRELRLQGAATTTSQMTDSGASHGNCDGITSEKTTLSASIKRLREAPRDEELKVEVNGEDQNCMVIEDPDELLRKELFSKQWKLLQFDKSYRPAYYGTFSKTSTTIGPRHPLKRDPSLNYEVDSDEEWEEEDPGESLSDCEDKEDDMEKLDNEVDEDAADGFVVPDGYLSDSEGVRLDDANNSIDGNNLETSTPELSFDNQNKSVNASSRHP